MMDKTDWLRGEWDEEPDALDWTDTDTGYQCAIRRGPGGHLCGYVGIPSGHPWHGKSYNDTVQVSDAVRDRPINIDKIGAINMFCAVAKADEIERGQFEIVLAVDVHGGLTYAEDAPPSAADDQKGGWWFGFDCAHSGDLTPKYAGRYGLHEGGEYRTFDYVKSEVESLARQLAAFATPSTTETGDQG